MKKPASVADIAQSRQMLGAIASSDPKPALPQQTKVPPARAINSFRKQLTHDARREAPSPHAPHSLSRVNLRARGTHWPHWSKQSAADSDRPPGRIRRTGHAIHAPIMD